MIYSVQLGLLAGIKISGEKVFKKEAEFNCSPQDSEHVPTKTSCKSSVMAAEDIMEKSRGILFYQMF